MLSVLDRIDHPRLFHREAQSLSRNFRCTIAAVGDPVDARSTSSPQIKLLALPQVGNRSVKRLLRIVKLIAIARKLQPDILYLHSIELLVPALIFCRSSCLRIVYDRHEDYADNIRYGLHIPPLFRPLLERATKMWELWAARRLDGVCYAETSFAGSLPLPEHRTCIVRNTYQGRRSQPHPSETVPAVKQTVILVSGTIALEWGALRSVQFWEHWCRIEPAHLYFAGGCRSKALIRQIEQKVERCHCAELFCWEGRDRQLAFDRVEEAISRCTFGLALYYLTPARASRIPTRFYEYMAWQKPLIYTSHAPWDDLNTRCHFGLSLPDSEPTAKEVQQVYDRYQAGFPHCYPVPVPDEEWSWADDGRRLVEFMHAMMRSNPRNRSLIG